MASVLILTINCEDDVDVNDTLFLLFGPSDAPEQFGENVKTFGDFVAQHEFTLTRVEE